MSKYKILVLDLDGTLTNKKKEITPRTLSVLEKAQQQGLKIVLASGRPTFGIMPLAEQLNLKQYGGYILSYNGGKIINLANGEVLYQNVLDSSLLPYLYKCAKDNDFQILSYKNEYVFCENPSDKYVEYEVMLNKMKSMKVENWLDAVEEELPKCLIVGDPEPLAILEKEMLEHLNGKMNVFRSEPFFLELVPMGIDKAKCLAILLEKIGVTKDEMIACGDGFNDLTMIQYAGLGVAMANAQDVVKEAADFVTLSNEEDGVAFAVEKFYLND